LVARITGSRYSDDIDGTSGADTIEGLDGNDRLWGHAGDDLLIGGAGHDDLDGGSGNDRMEGGTGDDLYVVDSIGDQVVEKAGEGIDVVLTWLSSYALGANVEDLVALSHADFHGVGNALDNYIYGYTGDDTLDGGAGNDRMFGDFGDDTYYVDEAGDQVIEYWDEGDDLVFTSLPALTLAANVEDMIFDGSGAFAGTGNALANYIEGAAGNDRLDGRDGDDFLNGGAGADQMIGGSGWDIFVVDNAGDQVVEAAGGGIDQVRSSISYTLGGNVEDLVLTGAAPLNGTGNGLVNYIYGNAAANVLDGKAGADFLAGGGGNDTYVVDNSGDRVSEAAGAGTDRILSSVSFTLGANVENLALTGTAAINGAGNALSNTVTGNAAANSLWGLGGNDVLAGGGGADRLFGGAGNDRLDGGAGADEFFFETPLNASTNVDAIVGFAPIDDSIRLNRSVFTAIAAGTLVPDAFHAGTAAQDAEDRIIYDSTSGRIFYDSDGTGSAAAILFATVAPGTALTNADFIAY
jgi:Ca2+-binding RTX toxin-like protein